MEYKGYIQRAIIQLIFTHMKTKSPLGYTHNNIINASVSFFNVSQFDKEFTTDFTRFINDKEGYKFIKILDNFGILGYILPEVAVLKKVVQNKKYGKTALEHTLLVLKYLEPKGNDILTWATLLHDIGKYNTKTIDKKGRTHFFFHEQESVKLAKNILKRFQFDDKFINLTCNIIKNHMLPLNFQRKGEWSKKALLKFIDVCGMEYGLIIDLAVADKKSSSLNKEYLKPLYRLKEEVNNLNKGKVI